MAYGIQFRKPWDPYWGKWWKDNDGIRLFDTKKEAEEYASMNMIMLKTRNPFGECDDVGYEVCEYN